MLHTDFLNYKYGEITINIETKGDIRFSHLIDENSISRTFAISKFYRNTLPKKFVQIDSNIQNGSIIGHELSKSGLLFDKELRSSFFINLPKWLKLKFNTEIDVAIGLYSEILICKDKILYIQICEIFHPEVEIYDYKENNLYFQDISNLLIKVNLTPIKNKWHGNI